MKGKKMQFEDALKAQLELQIKSFGSDPTKLSDTEKLEWIRWNVLALADELHEALAETGWKPWAKSKHINRDAYVSELVDAFHFLMNLMLVVDCSADEFLKKYFEKRGINADRQADGYDGVRGKCASCKRALDDPAVECTIIRCSNDAVLT
jgi:dimeric dUTPase (all-alpha-NTP-PPase superfamily)